MSLEGLRLAASQVASGQTGDTTGGTLGVNHMLAAPQVVAQIATQQKDALVGLVAPLTITGADGEPRPPQGAAETTVAVLRRAQQVAGAVGGLMGAIDNAADMGFAALTAPLAALCPSLPAATLGSLYIGTPHTHTHPPSLIPPAPPIPLPSIGAVLLGNSLQVLLGGMPAARAGDKGLAPTCGGLTPFFEIKLGSSNTFVGGKRAARIVDMCEACKPSPPAVMDALDKVLDVAGKAAAVLGIAADAGEAASLAAGNAALAAGKALAAAMQAAQMAADAAAKAAVVSDPGVPPSQGAIVVPGAPTVLIGGFPMIASFGVAGKLLEKLKGLARRLGGGKNAAGVGTGR